MKPMRLDKNGIPVLSRTDIDERVEAFIRYFDESCLVEPKPTPIASICTELRDKHGLNFKFGIDLGDTKEGYKYRGEYSLTSNTISIDSSLEYASPAFNFTLAHELGHYVLHRRLDLEAIDAAISSEIKDTNRELVLDHMQGNNLRSWLEWQANKFASSLLMPRRTLRIAVAEKQKEMGLTRNAGIIYLDRGAGSFRDFQDQIENLMLIFQSSKSSIRLRLRELTILIEAEGGPDQRANETKNLSELLSDFVTTRR